MAYATDRASMFGNGWAHAIDDEDVAQLLPVRGDQFNQGVCTLLSYKRSLAKALIGLRPTE